MIKAWTTIESIMMESGEDTGEILEREFIEVPNRQMRQKKEEVQDDSQASDLDNWADD